MTNKSFMVSAHTQWILGVSLTLTTLSALYSAKKGETKISVSDIGDNSPRTQCEAGCV